MMLSTKDTYTTDESPHAFGRWLLESTLMLLVAFGLASGIRVFAVQPYKVPTCSMATTINAGDHVLADKFVYHQKSPEIGDIVVVDDPTGEVETLVKRVVAVEGQTVDLADGSVVIDGEVLQEPYTHGRPSEPQSVVMPYVVPEGMVWLMGDNRTDSTDSRSFGAVPVNTVRGKVFCCYWPLGRIGGL